MASHVFGRANLLKPEIITLVAPVAWACTMGVVFFWHTMRSNPDIACAPRQRCASRASFFLAAKRGATSPRRGAPRRPPPLVPCRLTPVGALVRWEAPCRQLTAAGVVPPQLVQESAHLATAARRAPLREGGLAVQGERAPQARGGFTARCAGSLGDQAIVVVAATTGAATAPAEPRGTLLQVCEGNVRRPGERHPAGGAVPGDAEARHCARRGGAAACRPPQLAGAARAAAHGSVCIRLYERRRVHGTVWHGAPPVRVLQAATRFTFSAAAGPLDPDAIVRWRSLRLWRSLAGQIKASAQADRGMRDAGRSAGPERV